MARLQGATTSAVTRLAVSPELPEVGNTLKRFRICAPLYEQIQYYPRLGRQPEKPLPSPVRGLPWVSLRGNHALVGALLHSLAVTFPFPRLLGSDTIPIGLTPTVQFDHQCRRHLQTATLAKPVPLPSGRIPLCHPVHDLFLVSSKSAL